MKLTVPSFVILPTSILRHLQKKDFIRILFGKCAAEIIQNNIICINHNLWTDCEMARKANTNLLHSEPFSLSHSNPTEIDVTTHPTTRTFSDVNRGKTIKI
jgi:hypothetical protein